MLDQLAQLKKFEIEVLKVIQEDDSIESHYRDIKNDKNASKGLKKFFENNPLYQEVGKYLIYRLFADNEAFF